MAVEPLVRNAGRPSRAPVRMVALILYGCLGLGLGLGVVAVCAWPLRSPDPGPYVRFLAGMLLAGCFLMIAPAVIGFLVAVRTLLRDRGRHLS